MTPYQAVLWAAAIYAPIKPNVFRQVFRIGDWIVGYSVDPEGNVVIAIAGSQRIQDFIADAKFLPVDGGALGMLHGGFYKDALAVFAALKPFLTGKIVIVGHSLGASRSAILAGLCAINGIPVDQLYMFEPAKPGYDQLGKIVRANCRYILGTRNARDFVPDEPPSIPFPFKHVIDLVDLDTKADSVDPIDDHLLRAVMAGILNRWPEKLMDFA